VCVANSAHMPAHYHVLSCSSHTATQRCAAQPTSVAFPWPCATIHPCRGSDRLVPVCHTHPAPVSFPWPCATIHPCRGSLSRSPGSSVPHPPGSCVCQHLSRHCYIPCLSPLAYVPVRRGRTARLLSRLPSSWPFLLRRILSHRNGLIFNPPWPHRSISTCSAMSLGFNARRSNQLHYLRFFSSALPESRNDHH
jgi:hypothetical protein